MTHERVDDVPLLLAELTRMGVAPLLDAHFPTHGNWSGLSLGQVTVLWLTHLLSEGDHRLCHVQPWAESLPHTLSTGLGTPVRPHDLTDDRLAAVLRYLQQPERWQAFETALNQHSLRVYSLETATVRLDSTTASTHSPVTADGLFQFGHSKNPRRDLPILKLMAATLDPLGLPLVTTVLSGEHADDPLYLPALTQVRTSLPRGLLYVGDCKMAACATRACVARGGDYYLCPLSEKQLAPAALAALLQPVWAGEQATETIERVNAKGEPECLAAAFEVSLTVSTPDAPAQSWTERRLLVRSCQAAASGTTALHARLEKALAALAALNERGRGKPRLTDRAGAAQKVAQIEAHYQVTGLLVVTYEEQVHERSVRRRGANPARTVVDREVTVTARADPEAVTAAAQRLGWRAYATNAPVSRLSLADAVLTYRDQYLIEKGFGRLKGRPLSLEPMYLLRDDHATGLVHLLSLALRVLCVVEFQVRRALSATQTALTGLYPGNPARTTSRPSTELLQRAFVPLTLTRLPTPADGSDRLYLTSLSPLQQQLLELLQLPLTTYTGLTHRLEQPG